MPKVIIFDLDETLFKTKWEKYPHNRLSDSGEFSLSSSSEGIAKIPEPEDNVQGIMQVTAIERKRMKKIFDDVYEMMQKAKEEGKTPPIVIKVITAGIYTENYVKELFDQFFGENDNRFTNNSFPIEYFNKLDFDQMLHDEFRNFKRNPDPDNPEYKKFINMVGKTMDPCKAKVIDTNLDKWKGEMPNLDKKDIVLVDNAMYNIYGVEHAGFSFLHYPTTEYEREPEQRFSTEKENVFAKLQSFLEDAKQELQASKKSKFK